MYFFPQQEDKCTTIWLYVPIRNIDLLTHGNLYKIWIELSLHYLRFNQK